MEHAKVEGAVDENKSRVSDMRRLVDDSLAGHAQRMAAVETTLRDLIHQNIKDKEAAGFHNATIVIQHANVGRASNDGGLVAAAPSEHTTDLAFLDFHVEPPLSTNEETLKKLEFKDLAPPPRTPSPEFVRKSPRRMVPEAALHINEETADIQGKVSVKGSDSSVGAVVEETVENIVEVAGEDRLEGYGHDSMEAASTMGGEEGGESYHESYDGGFEDEREVDGDGTADDYDAAAEDAAAADSAAGHEEPVGDDASAAAAEGGQVTATADTAQSESKSQNQSRNTSALRRGEEEEEDEEEGAELPPQSEQEREDMETLGPDVRAVISKARMGNRKEFKELVTADPSLLMRAVDSGGNNLFHIAATNGKKKIVKELLRQGDSIDLYARNKKDKNVLDCAVEFKYTELADYLRDKYPRLSDPLQDAPLQDAAAEKVPQEVGAVSEQVGAAATLETASFEIPAEEAGASASAHTDHALGAPEEAVMKGAKQHVSEEHASQELVSDEHVAVQRVSEEQVVEQELISGGASAAEVSAAREEQDVEEQVVEEQVVGEQVVKAVEQTFTGGAGARTVEVSGEVEGQAVQTLADDTLAAHALPAAAMEEQSAPVAEQPNDTDEHLSTSPATSATDAYNVTPTPATQTSAHEADTSPESAEPDLSAPLSDEQSATVELDESVADLSATPATAKPADTDAITDVATAVADAPVTTVHTEEAASSHSSAQPSSDLAALDAPHTSRAQYEGDGAPPPPVEEGGGGKEGDEAEELNEHVVELAVSPGKLTESHLEESFVLDEGVADLPVTPPQVAAALEGAGEGGDGGEGDGGIVEEVVEELPEAALVEMK